MEDFSFPSSASQQSPFPKKSVQIIIPELTIPSLSN